MFANPSALAWLIMKRIGKARYPFRATPEHPGIAHSVILVLTPGVESHIDLECP
jgi:hypothetical protein